MKKNKSFKITADVIEDCLRESLDKGSKKALSRNKSSLRLKP
ncbi:MAG: hypothetical protein QME45_14375 [Clostridiales bacterium]|nr:hypothetical protein [Clostridiales bacterium]